MPGWSDISINDVLTGLYITIFGVIGWIGARVQWKKPEVAITAPTNVQFAGAVIDVPTFNNFVAALDMNTTALTNKTIQIKQNTSELKKLVQSIDEHKEVVEESTKHGSKVHDKAHELIREMQELRNKTEALKDQTKDLRDEWIRGNRINRE